MAIAHHYFIILIGILLRICDKNLFLLFLLLQEKEGMYLKRKWQNKIRNFSFGSFIRHGLTWLLLSFG